MTQGCVTQNSHSVRSGRSGRFGRNLQCQVPVQSKLFTRTRTRFPECCVRITADVSWMDGPVWTQPQPRVLSSETDEWSSGICDCCDDTKECCFAFWCGPCFACKISRTLGQCLCLPLLDAFGCIRPITLSMRVFVRQQYDIKGTLCNDCLCSTFCPQCVWCQMSREMKKRKLPTMLSDIVQR